ncbi:MAG: hypothetical protein QHH74_11920 [Spirochaetota bacterium]|nr:hypothetical protein [Spirochaetota bacterium]
MDVRLNYQIIEITDSISGDLWTGYFDSARVETLQPAVIHDNLSTMDASNYEPLPDSGLITSGSFYRYNDKVIYCIQTHERTIYSPEQTPALFSFYRENTGELEWIEGEKVEVGWVRIYNGKKYECIQAHMTLASWTPDITSALWKEVVEGIPVWVRPTGAHDAYKKGDKVHYPTIDDPVYESLIDANVWSPDEYPAGWKQL